MGVGLRVIDGGVTGPPVDGFEVGYVDVDGAEHREPLEQARRARFEETLPARVIRSYKGQRHLSGRWWSATTGAHVGFESWLERDHVMLLDFDPLITGIASQPFWLFWTAEDGKSISHIPDYFARKADGSGVVVDCRPVERRGERDVAKFTATEEVCDTVGWEYRLVGAADPVLVGNVRWLAGYRHDRHRVEPVAAALLQAFREPTPVFEGVAAVGDSIAVLPVLFHLLWAQDLFIDMAMPFSARSTVSRGARYGC